MELITIGILLSILWHIFSAIKHHVVYDTSFLRTNRDYHALSIAQWIFFILALSLDQIPGLIIIGSWLIGYVLSEILLARLFYTRWFPRRCDYSIAHMFFEKKWRYDFLLLIVGVILLIAEVQHLS